MQCTYTYDALDYVRLFYLLSLFAKVWWYKIQTKRQTDNSRIYCLNIVAKLNCFLLKNISLLLLGWVFSGFYIILHVPYSSGTPICNPKTAIIKVIRSNSLNYNENYISQKMIQYCIVFLPWLWNVGRVLWVAFHKCLHGIQTYYVGKPTTCHWALLLHCSAHPSTLCVCVCESIRTYCIWYIFHRLWYAFCVCSAYTHIHKLLCTNPI